MSRPARLPKRLPTGTRYVVEGRTAGNGQFRVSARYLVYPDGQRVEVPGETVLPISCCATCAQHAQHEAKPAAKRAKTSQRPQAAAPAQALKRAQTPRRARPSARRPVNAGLQIGA